MKLETMVSTRDLRQAAEDAKRAEGLGYDGVLTPETGHSRKLTLGTAVAIAFSRLQAA